LLPYHNIVPRKKSKKATPAIFQKIFISVRDTIGIKTILTMKQITDLSPSKPSFKRLVIALIVLWLIYAALNLLAPATRSINQYRINLTQISLLRVTILVPLLLIWLAALFAAVRFHYYTGLVSNSPESSGFRKIATGLLMLFLVIVVPSFISLVANYYPGSAQVEQYTTIIRLYVVAALYLLAFWYFSQGSKDLINTLPQATLPLPENRHRAVIAVMVLLAFAYAWAIFHNQFRTFSPDPAIHPTYFLPDWLIVTTIFLPYLLVWLWGIRSIVNIRAFAHAVPGIVYRKAFLSVSWGLTYVVVLLIGLQFLTQASAVFGRSSLRVILLIIYPLILAIALGYVFLARGARHLSTIEEV
jgi:hypothetical protein